MNSSLLGQSFHLWLLSDAAVRNELLDFFLCIAVSNQMEILFLVESILCFLSAVTPKKIYLTDFFYELPRNSLKLGIK